MQIFEEEVPNMSINLTYLGVTTLAKQGSRHPKRRLPTALAVFNHQGRKCVLSRIHQNEIDIDLSTISDLIRTQYDEYDGEPISILPNQGTDHILARIGDGKVGRFPIVAWAQRQVQTDRRWLPFFSEHLPFSVPRQLFVGRGTNEYPLEWSICTWIDGEPTQPGDGPASPGLVKDLARLLEAFRRLPIQGGPSAEAEHLRGQNLVAKNSDTLECIDQLSAKFDRVTLKRIWSEIVEASSRIKEASWFHGDLLSGNVLQVDGRLSGIIDFGGPGVGDWTCDLIGAWHLLNQEERIILRETLDISGDEWARGVGHTLSQAVIFLPYYENKLPRECGKMASVIGNIVGEWN